MKNEKEKVQIKPSPRWQQSKALSYNLKESGKSMEEPLGLKDKISSSPGNVAPKGSFSTNSFTLPSANYYRPAYHQEFCMWYPNFQKVQQSPLHTFQHQLYSVNFPLENQYQYVPLQMISLDKPHDFQLQEFQYFVVIDFEATCDKEKNPHPQEIIEFPSVLVNSVTGQLEASFQTYVRPAVHQHLSDFCKELTGIQQTQVDRGVPLSEALLMHDKWLEDKGIKHTNFAVVTWSNWDCRVMLESECRFKKIRKPPYFNRWINLKVPFQEVFDGVRCNLKEAVQLAGLPWEGRAHCGLDDARNTARLLAHLMRLGFRFSITNSLLWQSSDQSIAHQQLTDCSLSMTHYTNKPKQPSISQLHQNNVDPNKEIPVYCYCGVKSCKRKIRKPGPRQGSFFFGCGNWSATRGALCPYFEWASS